METHRTFNYTPPADYNYDISFYTEWTSAPSVTDS